MKAVDDAKRRIGDAKTRFLTAARLILGSPVCMAAAAAGAIAFGTQLWFAPARLPPVGGLSLAQIGLPPLDLGGAGDQLKQAADAARRQGAPEAVNGFLESHAWAIPYINAASLAACLAFLAWTIWIQARHYREPPAHRALQAPAR